jgi:hypothetical protein
MAVVDPRLARLGACIETLRGTSVELAITERQLYFEYCRRVCPLPGVTAQTARWIGAAAAIPAAFTALRPRRSLTWLGGGIAAALVLRGLRRLPFTIPAPVSDRDFAAVVESWTARHGPLEVVTAAPGLSQLQAREPDLYDYGLPRLLVCQDAAVAAMLRTNRFHVETACAVLTTDEAAPLPRHVAKMIARGTVYLLHDCNCAGHLWADTLRQQLGVADEVAVVALGLRPAQARMLHLFTRSERCTVHAADGGGSLKREPLGPRWCSRGLSAEVACIPPVRLLRGLRAMLLGQPRVHQPVPARRAGFLTHPDELLQ